MLRELFKRKYKSTLIRCTIVLLYYLTELTASVILKEHSLLLSMQFKVVLFLPQYHVTVSITTLNPW